MNKFLNEFLTEKNFTLIMTTAVLLILVIPVGIANVWLGYFKGESPCLLCGHERYGMILVGILGLFIVKFGVKIKYIASVFFVAFWFLFEGLRHVGNHAARDIGMGFGEAIFGLHTYSWAFVVYWAVILAMALMMFFIRPNNELGKEIVSGETKIKNVSGYTKFVGILSFVVVLSNVVQILITDGIPPYGGSGSPARFTWNIAQNAKYWDDHHWHENFTPEKASLWGANQGPKPWIPISNENSALKFNANFADNPLGVKHEPLKILETKELGFAALSAFKKGIAGGIAYDKVNNEFAIISSGGGVYFTDGEFKAASNFATIDQVNGMDTPISVDATYYAPGKVVATALNKTIWGVEKVSADKIDEKVQWKFLREVSGDLMPMFNGSRIPVMTTRGKKGYVLSLAKDPDSRYAYMLTLATKKSPKVILLKYDTKDNQISEETILEFAKDAGAKEKAKTSDFYVTGSDIMGGKMLALSKNFNALIVIDLANKAIEDAYELPNIGDAHDLAIVEDKLYVLSRSENKDKIFILNNPLAK